MNYRLLSGISLEAISIALFLVLALGVLFFVCISRNSKATEFVQVNKQRTGRSKRVLSILFAILSLSLILGSSIAVSSVQPTNVAVTYSLSDNVRTASTDANDLPGSGWPEADRTKTLSINKIRNADSNQIFALEGKIILDVEFRFYNDKKNNYPLGLLFIRFRQGGNESVTVRQIYRHDVENDPSIYYYITVSGNDSDEKSDQYVIQEYSVTWVDNQWFDIFKSFLDDNLVAIIITLLVAAAFWAIILGINMAKAPDSATAGKFKTRLWQLFIGLFILIALIFFLYWILGNISGIIEGDAIQDLRDGFNSSSFRTFLNKIK